MKRELLAATAALMICATSAFAGGYELQCSAPQTPVGDDAKDTNPVQRIDVDYSWDDHAWRVFHQLRNGAVVSRQVQYGITDLSNDRKTQWQGRLLRQPWLFMIGEIKGNGRGEYSYNEWMYDSKQGNRLVMQAMARCTARSTQQLPVPTAQLPTQPYAQAATPQAQAVPPAQLPTQPYAQAPAATPQAQADKVDEMLKNRDTMVAAVAILVTLPPNCTVNRKSPDGDEIARFVVAHGYNGDARFLAEVEAQSKKIDEMYEQMPAADKKTFAETTCAYGVILSAKVRDAQLGG